MAKQQTLKQFTWRSTDRNGKKIQGEISAVSLPMAKIQLRQQGISPSRIAMKGNSLFRRSQKVSSADVTGFTRQLATVLKAGVPLVEALGSVAGAAGNVVYQSAILQVKKSVEVGVALNIAMRDSKIFPPMLNQMVAIGEESGALDDMLAKSASIYEEEVDNAVGALSSLLEPAIMVIIGFLVGSLVIAMYLPIFKIGSAL